MKKNKNKNEIDFQVDSTEVVKTEEEIAQEEALRKEQEEKLRLKEEAKQEKKERNKERRTTFVNSMFILKMIGAAVLLGLGIWMLVDVNTAKQLVITSTGAVVALLSIGRIIWLFKDKESTKRFKLITLIEIIIDACVAVFLMIAGIKYQAGNEEEKTSKFVKFVENYYRYFIGVVFYARGVLHFFAVSFFKSKATLVNFVTNIVFLTTGAFCIFSKDATVKNIARVLTVLVLITCTYLGGDGIYQFIKFKNGNNNGEKRKVKDKNKDKNKEEVKEDIKHEEVPNAIIEPEETPRHENIVN